MNVHGTEVDTDAWPLVIIRMGEKLGDPAIDCILGGMDQVVERKAKFSLLMDCRNIRSFPDAKNRTRLGLYMKERTFAEAAYNCGNALITSSAIVRGVMTAMHWVRPPVTKHGFFATFDESLLWCCVRLREARVELSPAILELRETSARMAL
jgi:hypothetical protein